MTKNEMLNAIEKVIKETITSQAIKQTNGDYAVINLSLVRYRKSAETIYNIMKKSVKNGND